MDSILELEKNIILQLGWPSWACRSIEVLIAIVVLLSFMQYTFFSDTSKTSPNNVNQIKLDSKTKIRFRWFQLQYLIVYLIVMLADWLQGTNMYTLYSSYNVDIGALFLTGFLSSAIFGTFLGIYVDIWGRKLGCILFCVLEIIINLLEHIPHMPTLLLGRVLGGLSTSLLFSAFESWMVSEHRKNEFPEYLLESTFSISSWANGILAIIGGVIAQFSADYSGDIGPFQLAIALTVVCLVFIIPWRENYGNNNNSNSQESFFSSISNSLKIISSDSSIIYLGLSQACFEGGVYTFVFMWVPSMIAVTDGPVPTGLVFSSLMLAMTIGGMLFSLILPFFPGNAEGLSLFVYFVACITMLVPCFKVSFWWVYISFIVLEAMVGMFNSCGGILRSKYYPEGQHSSIMSVFRFPLNLLVVLGTVLTNNAKSIEKMQTVFFIVSMMHFVAASLQLVLILNKKHARNNTLKDKQA